MVWEDEVPAAEEAPAAGQPFAAAAVPGSDDAAPMETEAGAAEGEQLAKTRSGSPARAASSAKGSGLSDPAAAQKVLRVDLRGSAVTSQAARAVPGSSCTGRRHRLGNTSHVICRDGCALVSWRPSS